VSIKYEADFFLRRHFLAPSGVLAD